MSNITENITSIWSLNSMEIKAAQTKARQLAVRNAYLDNEIMRLRRSEVETSYLASHDSLTGKPSRELIQERFNQALYLANQHQRSFALIFLVLDKLKSVNDRLGHVVGDALLNTASKRLRSVLRYSDSAYRYGEDEFLILLSEVKNRVDASRTAEKICNTMNEKYSIDSHEIHISTSAGMAIYPDDSETFDKLLRFADQAMYGNIIEDRVISNNQKGSDSHL